MSIAKYQVSGMTCGGCVARVKAALASMAENVEVTLDPPQAILTNPNQSLASLNQVLAGVGHYHLSAMEAEPAKQVLNPAETPKSWLATYYPLLLIFGFILLVTL